MTEEPSGHFRDAERLVQEYVANPRADLKDLIVTQYSGLVERTARRFAGVEPVEDLVQVGFIGLLNALSKYDPANQVKFNTYATHLVAGEIKHYLRDKSQTIRQPAWLQELRHKVQRAATMLQAETGRPPLPAEIAESCGVSEQAVREVYATQELLRVASLDSASTEEDESESDVDRLEAAEPASIHLSVEDRVVLETAIKQLRELERDVLTLFHFESMNQTEIASKLGISCNYVSHILRQSVGKLRKILSAEEVHELGIKTASYIDLRISDKETGVYNQTYFVARLTEEAHRARANENQVAVIVVQFSGLDSYGSFYGAQSVSDFLADAADFLKQSLRGLDLVCRLGPSGFGLILPSIGENLAKVQNRLETKFYNWFVSRSGTGQGLSVTLGASIGPADGTDASTLRGAAEARAKELTGRRAA